MAPARLGHRPELDGLRGVAILAVLALHFFNVKGGFYGVDLFFVLSGFLITTLLLEDRDRSGTVSLRAFYIRRARRLLPALYSLIAAAAAFGAFQYSTTRVAEMAAAGGLYVANIARALPSDPHLLGGSPLDHLWSLAEEEQFYVLWPVALLFALKRTEEHRLIRWLGGIFVSLVGVRCILADQGYAAAVYFIPVTHADGLLIGCAAALFRRRGLTVGKIGIGAAAVTLAAMVLGPAFAWFLAPVVVAQAVMLLAAVQPGILRRTLTIRPLVYIGEISYSLYLWHELARWRFGSDHPLPAILFTVPLTLGSYYLIERRFRSRRHHQRSTSDGLTGASAACAVPVRVPAVRAEPAMAGSGDATP